MAEKSKRELEREHNRKYRNKPHILVFLDCVNDWYEKNGRA